MAQPTTPDQFIDAYYQWAALSPTILDLSFIEKWIERFEELPLSSQWQICELYDYNGRRNIQTFASMVA
jgi:hypothetical protein